jgi:hypothetical protein
MAILLYMMNINKRKKLILQEKQKLYKLFLNYFKNKSEDTDMPENNKLDEFMSSLDADFATSVDDKINRSVGSVQRKVTVNNAVANMLNAKEDAADIVSSEKVVSSVKAKTQQFLNVIDDITVNGLGNADLSLLDVHKNNEQLSDTSSKGIEIDWEYLFENIPLIDELNNVCKEMYANPTSESSYTIDLCIALLDAISKLDNQQLDPILKENLFKNIVLVSKVANDVDDEKAAKFVTILQLIQKQNITQVNSSDVDEVNDSKIITPEADQSDIKLTDDNQTDVSELVAGMSSVADQKQIVYVSKVDGEFLTSEGTTFFNESVKICTFANDYLKKHNIHKVEDIDFSTFEFVHMEKLISYVQTCIGTHPIDKKLPVLKEILVSLKEKMKSR